MKVYKSIYNMIGTGIYRFSLPLLWVWPQSHRSRCLVVSDDSILLVKNWLGTGRWTLPGGGVKPHETTRLGMVRELKEELDIDSDRYDLVSMGLRYQRHEGLKCKISLFVLYVDRPLQLAHRRYELADCQWFDIKSLPTNRNSLVDEALSRIRARA